MQNFLYKLQQKWYQFMRGRYGTDEFSQFILVVALIFMVLYFVFGWIGFNLLLWVTVCYGLFRMFSKNGTARLRENTKYLELYHKAKGDAKTTKSRAKTAQLKVKNRKTTLYFTCDGCGAQLSVPKGKGRLRVVCPKCHKEMFKNS